MAATEHSAAEAPEGRQTSTRRSTVTPGAARDAGHTASAPSLRRTERDIQAEVVRLLRARLPIVLEMNRERVLGAGNRTAAGRRATARIGAAGMADVLGVWGSFASGGLRCDAVGCVGCAASHTGHGRTAGVLLSVEVKRQGARTGKALAAKQRAWRQAVHRAGGIAVEVTSPAELAELLGWA